MYNSIKKTLVTGVSLNALKDVGWKKNLDNFEKTQTKPLSEDGE